MTQKQDPHAMPECGVCGRRKKPVGRDSMNNGYCDHECPGYYQEPLAGWLWPGETEEYDDDGGVR